MTVGAPQGNRNAKKQSGQNDPIESVPKGTAQRVAKDLGIGEKTVKRAAKFSKGVDAAEKIESGAREVILSVW